MNKASVETVWNVINVEEDVDEIASGRWSQAALLIWLHSRLMRTPYDTGICKYCLFFFIDLTCCMWNMFALSNDLQNPSTLCILQSSNTFSPNLLGFFFFFFFFSLPTVVNPGDIRDLFTAHFTFHLRATKINQKPSLAPLALPAEAIGQEIIAIKTIPRKVS